MKLQGRATTLNKNKKHRGAIVVESLVYYCLGSADRERKKKMEVFGVITGALGLLDQSRQPVSAIYTQHQYMKMIPRKCTELDDGLNAMKANLLELKRYDVASMMPLRIVAAEKISDFLKDAQKRLEEERCKGKSLSKVGRFFRAKKLCEILTDLIEKLDKLEDRALVIDGAASNQATTLQVSSEQSSNDSFVVQCDVPPTLDSLVLDVSDKETFEGRLNELVLRPGVNTVGAVGARVAAAHGMGGVGKTCALTAVGNDVDVQRHYRDAVCFFSFGQNATDSDVVKALADKVQKSGGHWLAKEIWNEMRNFVEGAVEKSQGWFGDRKCLLICDDMWGHERRRSGYPHSMRRVCGERGASPALLSTRLPASVGGGGRE